MSEAVNVLLATPCTQGGVTAAYLDSVLALHQACQELGWGLQVHARADGLVTRTRNIFASQMVRDEQLTHLLMVDSDIGFEPSAVVRLVASRHDLVGACVPFREVRWGSVRSALDRESEFSPDELAALSHQYAVSFEPPPPGGTVRAVAGFLPARFVGGAVLMARRDVFVKLADTDLVAHYDRGGPWLDWPGDGWTFFDPLVDPGTGTYLSEDYALCQRWRQAGGTVWADVVSRVTHHGAVAVTGDIALTLRTAARLVRRSGPTESPGDPRGD